MRLGRPPTIALLAAALLPGSGCGLAPHAFRKLQPTPATVRASSVGSDTQVVPALVNRLDDEDPVVRMAAGEELRRRTGKDFGFIAWASPEERAAAIARWKAWLKAPPMPADTIQAPELPRPASNASQASRRAPRRRRSRAQPPPSSSPAPPAPPALPPPPITANTIPAPPSSEKPPS